jgi:hypothetical protein
LSLVYIHMQMQIIDLAYQGKYKEQEMRQVMEMNGNLQYAILSMKSSHHLGGTLLTENSDMQFADPKNIMQVSFLPEGLGEEQSAVEPRSNPLLNLLSFATEAEAKGQE